MVNAQENQVTRKTARIMISYSRKDEVFVRQLYNGLVAHGFAPEDIWVDWEGIEISEDWMAKITKGIREANAFVFVISPDSIASVVCQKEIELANESNKRFIPILYRKVAEGVQLHEKLSSHNWAKVHDEKQLEEQLPDLIRAINTDIDWLERHTQLFNKAKEWEIKGRTEFSLLRGNLLQEAETFIGEGAAGKEPPPTQLHVEYVQASRKLAATTRRRSRIIAAIIGVILLGLTIFSLIQWDSAVQARDFAVTQQVKAETNEKKAVAAEADAKRAKELAEASEAEMRKREREARSLALAAESLSQRNNNTQLGLTLALLSIQETEVDNIVLDEAKFALFATLNAPNVLYTWNTDRAVVWATAYDPMGNYVAIGDESGQVQIIDLENPDVLIDLPTFGDRVSGLDFNDDGTHLAVSSWDGTAKIFDVESGDELFSLDGHGGSAINDVDYSQDGTWIATGGDDKLVKIWNGETGTLKVTLPSHTDVVTSVEFSPDSTRLVSGSNDDNAIIWDVENNSLLLILRPDGFAETDLDVSSVAFSFDGTRVMTGGYKTVVVWDALNGTEIQRLRGYQAMVYDLGFVPDSLGMVTASSGVKIWDGVNGVERFNLSSHTGEVSSLSFSSNGAQMLTGSWDFTAKLWAANLGVETLRIKRGNPAAFISYGLDGKWIIVSDGSGSISIYDVLTGGLSEEWSGYSVVDFNPQEPEKFLTVDFNGLVQVWADGQNEPLHEISDPENGIWKAIFSPNGKRILTVAADNTVKLWDAEAGGEPDVVGVFDGSSFWDIWFDNEEYFILTSSDDPKDAAVWDLMNGKSILLEGHKDWILGGVFSQDGKYVYTAGYDNTIRKWDVQTGDPVLVMTGHTGRILDLDVSSDGALIASASADNTVRVWDVNNGKELYRYLGNTGEVSSVVFSPDGRKVLTAGADLIVKEFTIDFDTLKQIALSSYELDPLTREECQRYLKRDNCALNLVAKAPVESGPGVEETPLLRSGNGTTPVTLVAQNNTSFDVDVFWIDFDGFERYYFSLAPGDIYEQGTYSTHIWRVRDTDGNIIADYTATDDPKQAWEIDGSGAGGDTGTGAAAATEVPAPSAEDAFYTEEFDRELEAWNSFMTSGSVTQVETLFDGGSLFVRLSPDEDKIPRFYLMNNNFEYSSVQLEVTATNHGNNANGVSLVCNYNDVNWYEFVISNSGLFEIYAYDPRAQATRGYVPLYNGGSIAIKSGQDATNMYRAVCNGNELSLFINDQLEITFEDTQYKLAGGRIGIGVSSPQMLTVNVSFDSLTVSKP